MTYFFILGKNPKLSVAEIYSLLSDAGSYFFETPNILFLDTEKDIEPVILMKHLGGTIKIGRVLGNFSGIQKLKETVAAEIRTKNQKIYFGISNYGDSREDNIKRVAMEIKKELKKFGPVRWVTSKEKILSSVVIKTNKILEQGIEICLFKKGVVGKTLVIQDFEEFEKRDYEKPSRDILRGMIPPKLAKIMINLSAAKKDETILDPFCGTGTILIEALFNGYKKIIGSDIDPVAINQTSNNLHWVREKYEFEEIGAELITSKAEEISQKIAPDSVGAIITEPCLGPLLKGNESEQRLQQTKFELSKLYLEAIEDWKKILKENARIVMVFPVFQVRNIKIKIDLSEEIESLGYKKIQFPNIGGLEIKELIYERPDQKLVRSIDIFEKTG